MPQVVIDKITLECQHLDEAAALYSNDGNNAMPLKNDCAAIQQYIKTKFPQAKIREEVQAAAPSPHETTHQASPSLQPMT